MTALGVYPHEEPGIGPNKYNFDDNVLYEIHVHRQRPGCGARDVRERFQFDTAFKNSTIRFCSPISAWFRTSMMRAQNLTQTYKVTKVDDRHGTEHSPWHWRRSAEQSGQCDALLQTRVTMVRTPQKDGVATCSQSRSLHQTDCGPAPFKRLHRICRSTR